VDEMNRRLAIVTGAASGIGCATAMQLIGEGWLVLALDRDRPALAALEGEVASKEALICRPFDVTEPETIDAVLADLPAGSRVAGLVNSAGIGVSQPFLETPLDKLRQILDVNLVGAFALCQSVARMMADAQGGAIVNISSGSGLRANTGRAAYGASKAGLELLSKVMAVELAPLGVRVNTVAPGPIETPLVTAMHSPADRARAVRSVPQGRYGQPQDIAKAVSYLLDDERSGYVTGHTLCVDGGFFAAGAFDRP
jgi:NAD(P)-dependent dehydrogenase (short-subunit alcohol dehydrogenase family)